MHKPVDKWATRDLRASIGFANPPDWLQASHMLDSPPDYLRLWLVPDAGIEPATFGLQNRCSTI